MKLNALAVSRLSTAYQKQAQTTHAPNGRRICRIANHTGPYHPIATLQGSRVTAMTVFLPLLSKYTQTYYTGYSAPKHICVSVCLILSFVEILPISERRTRAKAQIASVASAELAQADMTEHAELLQSSNCERRRNRACSEFL